MLSLVLTGAAMLFGGYAAARQSPLFQFLAGITVFSIFVLLFVWHFGALGALVPFLFFLGMAIAHVANPTPNPLPFPDQEVH